jgi:predicted transcriptional regulator
MLQVTELERKVLYALADEMYAEPGFSDAGLAEIETATGLSTKIIRGVGSSLVKKNLIYIDKREGEYDNQPLMFIWYLTEKTHGLVNHWVGKEIYKDILIKKISL